MKDKVNEFVDLFNNFHSLDQTDQIVRLVYFHTIEEGRESINKVELERLFKFAQVQPPKNLPQQLTYLCGRGGKLLNESGEFSLRREVQKGLEQEIRSLRGAPLPPVIDGILAFDFPGKVFKDPKIVVLLEEARKCYTQGCWNACGLLIRIMIERALDSVDSAVKAKQGLKDKINYCKSASQLFSKSVRESLEGLHSVKLIGDIAAHHSKIILDKGDIDLVLAPFRMLIKEVATI
jgi:hypothetical protein